MLRISENLSLHVSILHLWSRNCNTPLAHRDSGSASKAANGDYDWDEVKMILLWLLCHQWVKI